MKKILLVFVLVLVCSLSTSCTTTRGDWKYDDLPNDYSVWRTNSRRIILCHSYGTTASTIVDAYVSEIAYNNDYIFAKQVTVPEDSNKKIDTSNPSYYILVVETDELYGPYTEDEFNNKCEELEISEIPEWIKTTRLKNYVK